MVISEVSNGNRFDEETATASQPHRDERAFRSQILDQTSWGYSRRIAGEPLTRSEIPLRQFAKNWERSRTTTVPVSQSSQTCSDILRAICRDTRRCADVSVQRTELIGEISGFRFCPSFRAANSLLCLTTDISPCEVVPAPNPPARFVKTQENHDETFGVGSSTAESQLEMAVSNPA